MKRIIKIIREKKYFTMGVVLLLVAAFFVSGLWGFYHSMYEKEYENHIKSLQEFSKQGSVLIEERLTAYIHELDGIAAFLPKSDLHSEKNMEELRKRAEELDFQRIGLADANGKSLITNGAEVDISDREYFRRGMTGHKVITEIKEGKVNGKKVFMVVVPVLDEKDVTQGILYGVLEVDSFGVYEDVLPQEGSQYFQVIDINGEYIMKAENSYAPESGNNIFEAFEGMSAEMSAEEIKEKMEARECFFLDAGNGEVELINYFSPLRAEKWYVLSVLNKGHVEDTVKALMGREFYLLIAKMAAAFSLLCLVIVYYRRKEEEETKELYQQLKVNDKLVRDAIATSNNGVFIYDLKEDTIVIINNPHKMGNFPEVIRNAEKNLIGYLPESIRTKKQIEYIFDNVKFLSGKREFELTIQSRVVGEPAKNYVIHAEAVKDDREEIRQCVGIVEDVTENRYLKMEMELRERFLSGIVGFMVVNLSDNRILYLSKKMSEFCKAGDRYDENLAKLTGKIVDAEYRNYVTGVASSKGLLEDFRNGIYLRRAEYIIHSSQGRIWMESEIQLEKNASTGKCIAYFSLKNVDEKKKAELILREEAERDYLTGLYNRRNGLKYISQTLREHIGPLKYSNAFVMFDLDNFKNLNDTLGHQKGDEALRDVAQIMQRHFREYDIICRLAGDEFVVFLIDIPQTAIIRSIESLLKKLCLTYGEGQKKIRISASAGIAICPEQGTDVSELYEKADKALYMAKRNGKNSMEFYKE